MIGFARADQTDKYIQAHMKRIRAKSVLDRLTGVNGLGSIGSRSIVALPLLTPMLKDPDPSVRRAVALALPKISPDGVEAALFEAARGDSDTEVRENATKGLRDQRHVIEVVRIEKDTTLRRRAARLIQDAAVLVELANDERVDVRRDALMLIKDQAAVARLARELPSPEAAGRRRSPRAAGGPRRDRPERCGRFGPRVGSSRDEVQRKERPHSRQDGLQASRRLLERGMPAHDHEPGHGGL